MRLRSHLIVLVLAALVPILGFAAFVIRENAALQLAVTERGMRETARAVALTVDKELETAITTLEALAETEYPDAADLGAFHALCRRVVQTQRWSNLLLFDTAGRTLMHTGAPLGALLPPARRPEIVARVRDEARPVVSDLFDGGRTRHLVAVYVPVVLTAPVAIVEGALRRGLWQMLAAAAVATALAATLAFLFGRQIAAAVGALVRIARAVERGDRAERLSTGVAEVNALAEQLAAAADLAQAREQDAAVGERQARAMAEVARALNASPDLDTVLRTALEAVRGLVRADSARIALVDDTGRLVLRFSTAESSVMPPGFVIERGHGIGGRAGATGPARRRRRRARARTISSRCSATSCATRSPPLPTRCACWIPRTCRRNPPAAPARSSGGRTLSSPISSTTFSTWPG